MTAIKNGTLLVKDSNGNTARVATLSQTDITTLNTALTDIEANKKRISSISANYVTTNTKQIITETKTIQSSSSSPIFLQDTRFDRKTSPEQDIFNSIVFLDKNAKNAGFVQSVQRKDSNNAFYLAAARDKNGQSEFATLGVVFPRDTTKVAYATAPQTPTLASNNEIATAKFVNDKINLIKNNYVTTNTAQDITAVKTFKTTTNHVVTKVVVTDRDNSVAPTEEKWTDVIEVRGKNDTLCGVLAFNQWTDGSNSAELHAAVPMAPDNHTTAYLGIRGFKDGSFKTMCYTPHKDSNSSEIATTEWVRSYSMPVGTIIPFSGSSIPAGYLLCNGVAVSRTTYANLFKVIGTTWGAGDGSTTFKLPDARGRFPEGANGNLGAYHAAGLPNITGDWRSMFSSREDNTCEGAAYFYYNDRNRLTALTAAPNNRGQGDMMFHADRSNAIYGASGTVQPNSFCIQYLIKY